MGMRRKSHLMNDIAMARRLSVSREWLRAEARNHRIPSLQAGDRFLFNAEAVERVLLERAGKPPKPHGDSVGSVKTKAVDRKP